MSNKKVSPANVINTAISKAKSVQVGHDLYSNLQRVTITQNELIIDFYTITPDLANSGHPQIVHLQRVILPIMVAKDFSRILTDTTSGIEFEISSVELVESESNAPGKAE